MRGEHLLLDAADGQHLAAQRDLARHRHVACAPVGRVASEASAVTIVTPADGPSLGMAPAGTCTWTVLPSKTPGSMPSASALDRT